MAKLEECIHENKALKRKIANRKHIKGFVFMFIFDDIFIGINTRAKSQVYEYIVYIFPPKKHPPSPSGLED